MSSSTKEVILHEASKMLLSRGLNGFSLQELAQTLNLKKASLFHHYPSKNALAVELYRFYQRSFEEWAIAHNHLTAERQMISYAEKLTDWICNKKRVCPVGALSLEWQLVDPELQAEIKKLHHLHRDWLSKLFKEFKSEHGLKLSINDAVNGTMGLIQGSIQIARINSDTELVKKNLKNYLKTIKD